MSPSNAQLVRQWFEELWNLRRAEIIDVMLDPEVVIHGLGAADGEPLRGVAEFRTFYSAFRAAFPDLRVSVEDVLTDSDKVVARCHATGTHTGDGLGLTATGRKVQFGGITIVRVRDGRFVESWNHFDFLLMYQQLGVLPTLESVS